jgi:hypothetical protein
LTGAPWRCLEPHLPPEKPRTGRPNEDHRRILNGILWVLRTGVPWRDLPRRYGPVGTVSSRFYLYGLLPLRKRSLGWVHRPVCVPVSGVMGLPQRPNGKSARAGLNRWPAYGWPR